VNPGWEAYGGIIRDVYAEVRPAAFVDNVRLGYKLERGYTRGVCQAQVRVSSTTETAAQVELVSLRAGSEAARVKKTASLPCGASAIEVAFDVVAPVLWSPEEPNLYELTVTLRSDHGADHWSCRTGFREVVARGPDFPWGDVAYKHGLLFSPTNRIRSK